MNKTQRRRFVDAFMDVAEEVGLEFKSDDWASRFVDGSSGGGIAHAWPFGQRNGEIWVNGTLSSSDLDGDDAIEIGYTTRSRNKDAVAALVEQKVRSLEAGFGLTVDLDVPGKNGIKSSDPFKIVTMFPVDFADETHWRHWSIETCHHVKNLIDTLAPIVMDAAA